MKTLAMLCALVGGMAFSVQDQRPQDPQKAPKARTESSEPKGIPQRDPLEGLYELRARTVKSAPDLNRSRGYVAITRRHMLICLAGAGVDPDYPLLRAGVRSWGKRKEGIETVVKLGFFTDEDGEIHVEEPGALRVRRIDLIRGKLRIWQDDQSFLDFERIE